MKKEITTVDELIKDIEMIKNDLEAVKNGLYKDVFSEDDLIKRLSYKQDLLEKWLLEGRD